MSTEYISPLEAAEILGVSESSIRYYLKKGYISHKKTNKSCIDKESVVAFAREAMTICNDINSIRACLEEELEHEKSEHKAIVKFVRELQTLDVIATLENVYKVILQGNLTRECEMAMSYLSGKNIAQIADDYSLSKSSTYQLVCRALRRGKGAFIRQLKALQQFDDIKQQNCQLQNEIKIQNQIICELNKKLPKQDQVHLNVSDKFLLSRWCDLGVSMRAINCLKSAGIDTVYELCLYNKQDLLKFRNFGKKTLTELEEFLKEHGLSFKE